MHCHMSFRGGGGGVQTVPLWQEVERKRAELLSTEGGSAVGLRREDRRELEPF